jgi:hypothetical protein
MQARDFQKMYIKVAVELCTTEFGVVSVLSTNLCICRTRTDKRQQETRPVQLE